MEKVENVVITGIVQLVSLLYFWSRENRFMIVVATRTLELIGL